MSNPIKAKITIRLDAISHENSSAENITDILKHLPTPDYYYLLGETRILSDNRVFHKPNENTIINFKSQYEVFDIEEANIQFKKHWLKYTNNIKLISKEYTFKFQLNYEIVVFNLNYPSLIFNPAFLKFIADLNFELSFYFYND